MLKLLLALAVNLCSGSDSTQTYSEVDSIYHFFYDSPDSIVSFVSLSQGNNANPFLAPIATFDITEKEKVVALILDGKKKFLSLAFAKTLAPGKYDVFCFYNERVWIDNQENNFFLLLYRNNKKRFYYFMK